MFPVIMSNFSQVGDHFRGLRKILNGLNVRGKRAEQRAQIMSVVIVQGELLQMIVGAHAQIVGDPLADAGGA